MTLADDVRRRAVKLAKSGRYVDCLAIEKKLFKRMGPQIRATDRHKLLVGHRLQRDIAGFNGPSWLTVQPVRDLLDGL
jgi:hypothetical protein